MMKQMPMINRIFSCPSCYPVKKYSQPLCARTSPCWLSGIATYKLTVMPSRNDLSAASTMRMLLTASSM
jgi:hypothetical protein